MMQRSLHIHFSADVLMIDSQLISRNGNGNLTGTSDPTCGIRILIFVGIGIPLTLIFCFDFLQFFIMD